ncbi:MAG: hypothetical protein ACI4DL_06510 [Lachnospiraceae bacterium]
MRILDYIPIGHRNAVTRNQLMIATGLSDRKIREMIETECTREHPILNLQDGKGYFQPSCDEMYLVRLYRTQENKRTLKIRKKVSELDTYIKNQNNELERNQISIFDVLDGRE